MGYSGRTHPTAQPFQVPNKALIKMAELSLVSVYTEKRECLSQSLRATSLVSWQQQLSSILEREFFKKNEKKKVKGEKGNEVSGTVALQRSTFRKIEDAKGKGPVIILIINDNDYPTFGLHLSYFFYTCLSLP